MPANCYSSRSLWPATDLPTPSPRSTADPYPIPGIISLPTTNYELICSFLSTTCLFMPICPILGLLSHLCILQVAYSVESQTHFWASKCYKGLKRKSHFSKNTRFIFLRYSGASSSSSSSVFLSSFRKAPNSSKTWPIWRIRAVFKRAFS